MASIRNIRLERLTFSVFEVILDGFEKETGFESRAGSVKLMADGAAAANDAANKKDSNQLPDDLAIFQP